MSYGPRAAEQLADKTVLLTGASSGIGKAAAIELAAASNGKVRLILAARRLEKLEELKSILEADFKGISVLPTSLDISDFQNVPKYLETLPKEWSNIDIVINNAGIALGAPAVGAIPIGDLTTVYSTNILGIITLTNALMAVFRERGSGDMLFVGSIAGLETLPNGSVYSSTKHALHSFVESLRKETIQYPRIRVMEVDPGLVVTGFAEHMHRGDKAAAKETYSNKTPLAAEDIAEIIVFALSRRQNTVLANTVVYPTYQAAPGPENDIYLAAAARK